MDAQTNPQIPEVPFVEPEIEVGGDPSELLDAVEPIVPQLVAEFLRLRAWCGVCLGEDVAKWKGREV